MFHQNILRVSTITWNQSKQKKRQKMSQKTTSNWKFYKILESDDFENLEYILWLPKYFFLQVESLSFPTVGLKLFYDFWTWKNRSLKKISEMLFCRFLWVLIPLVCYFGCNDTHDYWLLTKHFLFFSSSFSWVLFKFNICVSPLCFFLMIIKWIHFLVDVPNCCFEIQSLQSLIFGNIHLSVSRLC